jgi:hypothetical protein
MEDLSIEALQAALIQPETIGRYRITVTGLLMQLKGNLFNVNLINSRGLFNCPWKALQ